MTAATIQAAALVTAAWVVAGTVLLALGGVVAPWVLARKGSRSSPNRLFWSGFAILIVVLQAWHLWMRVDGRSWLLVVPLAALGAWRLRSFVKVPRLNVRAALVATASSVLIGWAAVRALRSPGNPDTCLYYLQTVRWMSSYPIVRGLGNLNYLLAFNDSYFLYVAWLDVGPFWHKAEHVANGLLILSVALRGTVAMGRLLGSRPPRRSEYLWAIALGLALDEVLGPNLTSPAADAAVWALDTVTMIAAAAPLIDGEATEREDVTFIALLAAVGLTVKPTSVLVAVPFGLLALWHGWRSAGRQRIWIAQVATRIAAIGLVAIVPWMVRGTVLSGYPSFPSTWPNLHLSWRVPEAIATHLQAYVAAYARYKSQSDFTHGSYAWRLEWLQYEWLNNRTFLIPFGALSLGALLLAALAYRTRQAPRELPVILAGLASVAIWFQLAPDTRFLGPTAWLLDGVLILAILQHVRAEGWAGRASLLLFVVLVQLGAFVNVGSRPLPQGFEPELQERYVEKRLSSGDVIHEDRGCCLELPCGMGLDKVRMRKPGDLGGGFYSTDVAP